METESILNTINQGDRSLLTAINFDGPTGYDFFWAMYSDKWTWIPFIFGHRLLSVAPRQLAPPTADGG